MPPQRAPVPAKEAAEVWDGSRAATVFAVASLAAVGVLAFGAGQVLAPLVWHGDPDNLGLVRAVLALIIAFVAGPTVILLLLSAFRHLNEAWHRFAEVRRRRH